MRAIAMKCDRCGKFCEYVCVRIINSKETNEANEANEANEFTLIDMHDIYSDRRTYDLCPECMREFKKFLENK